MRRLFVIATAERVHIHIPCGFVVSNVQVGILAHLLHSLARQTGSRSVIHGSVPSSYTTLASCSCNSAAGVEALWPLAIDNR